MQDPEDENPSPGYWPSVSDLFITLFIIAIAILAAAVFALLPKNNVDSQKAIIVAVGHDLVRIRQPVNELREILGMDPIRPAQTPDEVVAALEVTCRKAGERIRTLESNIRNLSKLDAAREQLAKLQEENRALKASQEKLAEELEHLRKILRTIEGVDIEAIIAENLDLRRQLNDKPPIIQITEQKEEYRFSKGSSLMKQDFIEGLRLNEFDRLAREIIERDKEGRVKVDTLEITGHTDGTSLSGDGNLDRQLPGVLGGEKSSLSTLKPGSNNDLGLLRALAVREQWNAFVKEKYKNQGRLVEAALLQKIQIRCYSAGQTVLPVPKENPKAEDFRQDDAQARRIEMRLTRLKTDEDHLAPDRQFKEGEK
jgi:hypothetical protein